MKLKTITSITVVATSSILLAATPAFAKAKAKDAKSCQSSLEIVDAEETQRLINDYKEQIDQIDQKELESDNFDHALFDKVRSTYEREIRRLEKLKPKKS